MTEVSTDIPADKVPVARATHPFDDSECSDIILRTSDKVDFYVCRAILSIASPFFKSMFSLPQDDSTGCAIDVSEDSKTIDPLLRFCYPVVDPVIKDLTLLRDVLEAGLKYETTEAIILLKNHLHTFIESNPLQVYTIACYLSLEEIASLAAQKWRLLAPKVDGGVIGKGQSVEWEKTIGGGSYVVDMAKISAGAFYRLTEFVRTGIAPASFCEYKKSSSGNSPTPTQLTHISLLKGLVTPTSIPSTNISPCNCEFNFADSDLTIRSSEGYEFKVHNLIIRLASPTMLDKVTSGHMHQEPFRLPESGSILSILFKGCYPSMSISSAELDIGIVSLSLAAACKYRMLNVIERLKAILKGYVPKEPLSVYFTFVQNGLLEDAVEVARETLFLKPLALYVPEMEKISAKLYYLFLHYRYTCLSNIVRVGSKYEYISSSTQNLQWWSAIERSSSNFIYLAGSVVERHLRNLQTSVSNIDPTNTAQQSSSMAASGSVFGFSTAGSQAVSYTNPTKTTQNSPFSFGASPSPVRLPSLASLSQRLPTFSMDVIHEESLNFKKEVEECLTSEDAKLKTKLLACSLSSLSAFNSNQKAALASALGSSHPTQQS